METDATEALEENLMDEKPEVIDETKVEEVNSEKINEEETN